MTRKIIRQRLERLRTRLAEQNLDGMVIVEDANRRYMSGFTGSTGWVVVTQDEAFLVTDGRYWERAHHEAPDITLVKVAQNYQDALHHVLRSQTGRWGFEGDTVTVNQFESMLKPMDHLTWVPADEILYAMRSVKSDEELAIIRRAAALTDEAMAQVPNLLRPGITEAALAWELEKYMREHGAEGLAFPIIVAFGENAALPHAEPGDRPLKRNMAVCIDMGARVDGYCADLTRSFWYGPEPEEDYLRAWEAVHQAVIAATVTARPGVTGRLLDAVARDVLNMHGYGQMFLHSLGHGVGLVVHEHPRLSRRARDRLEARHVITLEPGVYNSGRWGIRLEELAIVWDNGVEIVSRAPLWRAVT